MIGVVGGKIRDHQKMGSVIKYSEGGVVFPAMEADQWTLLLVPVAKHSHGHLVKDPDDHGGGAHC